jgi:hypothetical protein
MCQAMQLGSLPGYAGLDRMRNHCEMDAALSLIAGSSADNDIDNFMLVCFGQRFFGASCKQCPDYKLDCGKIPDSKELKSVKSLLSDALQEYQDIFELLRNA